MGNIITQPSGSGPLPRGGHANAGAVIALRKAADALLANPGLPRVEVQVEARTAMTRLEFVFRADSAPPLTRREAVETLTASLDLPAVQAETCGVHVVYAARQMNDGVLVKVVTVIAKSGAGEMPS